jgi:hypothetical protein
MRENDDRMLKNGIAPGEAISLGDSVILSAAKNLRDVGEILRSAQNDRFARISCRTHSVKRLHPSSLISHPSPLAPEP